MLGFIDFLKRNGISSYRKCYAFEPDTENYNKLLENTSGLTNIAAYKLGTHICKDKLHFSDGMTTGSSIQGNGRTVIEVDSIDNIINGEEVTYIKMDVEGAELDSLKGARKTILKNHPKLAICVYHKMEDLITIPDYILSLHSDYKLFLRNYMPLSSDTVLYAL